MNANNKTAIHGLSDGRGMFWALRSLLVPRRDVELTPEAGIYEPQPLTLDTPEETDLSTASVVSDSNATHQIYLNGGQMRAIYTQQNGRRFTVSA